MKLFIIIFSLTAFSFADIIPSFFIDYSYGIPLKNSYLGHSITKKRVTDTLKFDREEHIYGSFGKGNKIASGFDFNLSRFFNISLLGTYHFQSKYVIKRRIQEAVDDDTYTFSMISINFGIKFLIKSNKLTFFAEFFPGFYIPLEVKHHGYITGIDSYYNFTGRKEEYSVTLDFESSFGFFSTLGFQIPIFQKISLKFSAGPEYMYSKEYIGSQPVSFSSFRLISGLIYTFK